MDNKQQKSKELNLKSHLEDKKSNKSLIVGSLIATFIALSPYLFYLYESVPQQQVWDTFLFTYDSKSWGDANLAMWILTGKIIPLILLFIWFFSCRHWWYHALIVPIAMYTYQILVFLNADLSYLDEFQLIYLVPVMALIIPSIYLIRARMFDKLNTANKTMEQLEEEFSVRPKTVWAKIKQYF